MSMRWSCCRSDTGPRVEGSHVDIDARGIAVNVTVLNAATTTVLDMLEAGRPTRAGMGTGLQTPQSTSLDWAETSPEMAVVWGRLFKL